jgi:hypothetical protein
MKTKFIYSLVALLLICCGAVQSSHSQRGDFGRILTAKEMSLSVGASGFFQECNGTTANCPGAAACQNPQGGPINCSQPGFETEDGTFCPTPGCITGPGVNGCSQGGAYKECQWCLPCIWCSQGGANHCGNSQYPACDLTPGTFFVYCAGTCSIVTTNSACRQDC